VTVRGVLHVHSAPPALSPHIEWAVAGVLGVPVTLPWADQPASPGMLRTELDWEGRPGAAGAITSALAGWNRLRFEVTEEASPGCDAVRYSYTPSLGTFSAVTAANGDVLVPEGRLRAALTLAAAGGRPGSRAGGRPAARPGARPGGPADGSGLMAGTPAVSMAGISAGPGAGQPAEPVVDKPTDDLADGGGAGADDGERPAVRHPALGGSLAAELRLLLGQPWDDELEPFRHAGAGAPVRWLHAASG
jgi:Protein of unknown function (DUF3145)